MIIVGEKINGTLTPVKRAILERDAAFIAELAAAQVEAGAHMLDVNAGTEPEREVDDLKWLVGVVEDTVQVPICLDNPRPETITEVLPYIKRPGLINSVTDEGDKPSKILPLAKKCGCGVIALTLDNRGIPADAQTRVEIAEKLISMATEEGIEEENIYVDPLVIALSTNHLAGRIFNETVATIRERHPKVRIISGLSNISFGLPARKVVNKAFLVLARAAGMDAAIMDPLDGELMALLFAAEAVLGNDRYCRNYTRYYRSNKEAFKK